MSADVAHARIDRDGRLVDADPRLATLNAEAGGAAGQPIAVPALAQIARLAQRLQVVVSRPAPVRSAGGMLDLWVRARPDPTGVSLSATGWTPVPPAERAPDIARAGADWTAECDRALTLTRIGLAGAEAMIGRPLTELLRFDERDGALPILAAVATRTAFSGQPATLRRGGAALTLSGAPVAGDGGYRIAAERDAPPPSAAGAPMHGIGLALRRPLDRILAGAEGMSAERGSNYAGYADDIAGAARHLLALVDDLVDLEAIERPGFRVPVERIDIAPIVRRAAGLLGVRAGERGVRLDPPGEGEQATALGDPRRVLQILINLVGNAVRHSPPGGMVWLRLESAGPRVRLVVADQGGGIAAENHARVFEKFERVQPAEPGGSGLGLYISRRLARAMGGDILLDSAPGQGARFTLDLRAA